MLGVGRSTVREALNGLATLGLVEARHGAGVFVATEPAAPTPEHSEIAKALAKGVTRELLEAREIIEVAIARLAAQRRTDADVREIAAVLEAHRRSLATPAKPAMQFHIVLAEAAHNEVLAGMFKSFVKLMVKRGPGLYAKLKNFGQWELEEHRSIFEAVCDGNADEAARRMAGHVKAMATHYRKVGSA
jgi:DNA-binding FadR family transcriptional regulator